MTQGLLLLPQCKEGRFGVGLDSSLYPHTIQRPEAEMNCRVHKNVNAKNLNMLKHRQTDPKIQGAYCQGPFEQDEITDKAKWALPCMGPWTIRGAEYSRFNVCEVVGGDL